MFCNIFLDREKPEIRFNLGDRPFLGGNDSDSEPWCDPRMDYPYFRVAAESFLHKITHLGCVARAAGMPPSV